jgi:hypothetical protein
MSSLVSRLTEEFIRARDYGRVSTGVDLVVTLLLLAVLVERELIRAAARQTAAARVRPFTVVAAPLLLAFVLVVVLRSTGHR